MRISDWSSDVCSSDLNKRFIRTYTNGQFNNETEITNYGSITNNIPLMIGGQPDNGQADCYIADVRFWKVALPDDVIRQYSCEIGIAEDHPYYDFLAGLWQIEIGRASVRERGCQYV